MTITIALMVACIAWLAWIDLKRTELLVNAENRHPLQEGTAVIREKRERKESGYLMR